ncbi:MAG: hypothetical protein ACOC12_04310, partial [Bacteroidota bacterium]
TQGKLYGAITLTISSGILDIFSPPRISCGKCFQTSPQAISFFTFLFLITVQKQRESPVITFVSGKNRG